MKLRYWKENPRDFYSILGLTVLVLFVFHNAFQSGLVFWDDDVFILRNEILKMGFWDAARTTFTSYYHGDYLPLTIMSYWMDVQIFGVNWTALHTMNLLYHIINVVLVYFFVLRFKGDWSWAFVIAVFFAIHPLQAEPVIWISERKSLISGIFAMGSLLFYLRFIQEDRRKYLVYALVFYVFSMLAKMTSIMLPFLFFFLDKFYADKKWKEAILRLVPSVVLIGVISVLRTISYDYSTPGVVEAMWNPGRLMIVPEMAANALFFYVQKFFWPEHLSALYEFYIISGSGKLLAATVFIAFSTVVIYFLRRKRFEALFFFLLFFLFLLPVLHLVPRANYVNDRYMYLPIIGFTGLMLELIQSLCEKIEMEAKKVFSAIVFTLMIPVGVLAYQQSKIWENNLVFWEHTVEHNPYNILARNALGLEYHERLRYDEAKYQFEFVLALKEIPMSLKLKAVNNLANVYTDKRYPGYSLGEAAKLYEMGIKNAERRNLTYELRINLAQAFAQMDRRDEAMQIVTQVYQELQRDPDARNIWLIPFIEKMVGGKPQTTNKK